MKPLASLACLLLATTGLAQQIPVPNGHSLGNTDRMPVLNGRGNALDMPTRNGKGSAIAMPNRPTPVPDDPAEQSAVMMESLKGQVQRFLADSSNREKPDRTLPSPKR